MTPEEQRIAIAGACGYINARYNQLGTCIASTGTRKEGGFWGECGVPDYINDLNAIREAEMLLVGTKIPEREWAYCIMESCCYYPVGSIVPYNQQLIFLAKVCMASPQERCVALLKCLELWDYEEGEQ